MRITEVPRRPGLYVVGLNNVAPIDVRAGRAGGATAGLAVTRANCKFGKAADLRRRRRDYTRTFGDENVCFLPVAVLEHPGAVEPLVAARLHRHRLRGPSNRLFEWMHGTSVEEVATAVVEALEASGLPFECFGVYGRIRVPVLLATGRGATWGG